MARPLVLLAVVTWGGAAIVFSWVILFIVSNDSFPVRNIEVNGNLRQLQADVVRAVAQPYLQRGFFFADIDTLRQELARDPWVRDVVVRRRWPDSIRVDIVEEQAFARWRDEGFLSYKGEFFVLNDVATLSGGLPLMSGHGQSHQEVFAKYRHISAVLDSLGLQVDELHLSKRNSWWMKLDNGWRVYLGRERVERNLQRLAAVVFYVLAGRTAEVDKVDMRYENGYAVVWKQLSVPASDLTAKLVE